MIMYVFEIDFDDQKYLKYIFALTFCLFLYFLLVDLRPDWVWLKLMNIIKELREKKPYIYFIASIYRLLLQL